MQVELQIKEYPPIGQYSHSILKIGRLEIASYGYNYSYQNDEGCVYIARPLLKFFKKREYKFKTSEEAKAFAYKIANKAIEMIIEKEVKE